MNTTTSKLEISTPSECEIVMKREFNAPRVLVWRAWTQPEHVAKWWGCDQSQVPRCEIDLRDGGAWHITIRLNDENDWDFYGVYREIEEPQKLVHTQIFAQMPQHETLVTVRFEEHDGRTEMTETILYNSREARDAHINSGMEGGTGEAFDKLEALLRSSDFLNASITGEL